MRIPKGLRLHEFLEETAPADRSGIWLRDEGLEIISKVAALRVPVEGAADDAPGHIPATALRLALDLHLDELIVTRRSVVLPGVGRLERGPRALKPPSFTSLAQSHLTNAPTTIFAVNAHLLAQAARAIGAVETGVFIEIRDPEGPIYLRPRDPATHGEAIVLPMRLTW